MNIKINVKWTILILQNIKHLNICIVEGKRNTHCCSDVDDIDKKKKNNRLVHVSTLYNIYPR